MRSVMDIIGQVRQLTEDGSLKWDQGLMSTTFDVKISKYILTTWTWTDQDDGTSGVSVRLSHGGTDGTVLDDIAVDQYSPKYDELYSFYKAARRNALNVNSEISELQKDLSSLAMKQKKPT